MATTSLWHISGSLQDLADYVENPEKTMPDLWNAAAYVERPAATADGSYVTAINCLRETAVQQMILTKKQYGKTGGYIAFHGYQSFKPNELTAQECHDIGIALAKEMWGGRFQIIVTTHLDKEHLHNHFFFNSVSFRDGRKYNYSRSEQRRLREVSDRLCAERGLSIVQHPHKAPSRPVYLAEKSGKPTRYSVYLNDVWDAIELSRSPRYVENYLRELGYLTDFTGAHWKLRLPQYKHFTRLDTLDERLTPEFIRHNCGYRAFYGNSHAVISYPPSMPSELERVWQPYVRTTRIYRLYLRYCFELGILPKGTKYRPTSPFLKEELRKLDLYDRETRFLGGSGIETMAQLQAEIAKTRTEMDSLTDERKHVTYAMRRATPEKKAELQKQKACLTKRITPLRKKLKLMRDIERRSEHIDRTLTRVYESELYQEKHRMRENNERSYER